MWVWVDSTNLPWRITADGPVRHLGILTLCRAWQGNVPWRSASQSRLSTNSCLLLCAYGAAVSLARGKSCVGNDEDARTGFASLSAVPRLPLQRRPTVFGRFQRAHEPSAAATAGPLARSKPRLRTPEDLQAFACESSRTPIVGTVRRNWGSRSRRKRRGVPGDRRSGRRAQAGRGP